MNMPPRLDDQQYRKFALLMAFVLSLFVGLALPWALDTRVQEWPFFVSLLLLIWAAVSPGSLWVIYVPWMRLAVILGYINTRIILTLVFYLLFTPISLFMKLAGKDPLNRNMRISPPETYWKAVMPRDKSHMEKIY
jgi:hypothetical protein